MRCIIRSDLGMRLAAQRQGSVASFRFPRVSSGRGGAATLLGRFFFSPSSRHPSARAPSPVTPFPASYPHAVKTIPASAWRTSVGKFLRSDFFPESEAQRLTLGPRLPHQRRHPLTLHEAAAGLVLVFLVVGATVYLFARFL